MIAENARGLLEELEAAEKPKKEPFVPPKIEFNQVSKVADIFRSRHGGHIDIKKLRNAGLADGLLVSFLVENLITENVNAYLAQRNKQTMQKLILADVVAGLVRNTKYDPSYSLEKIAMHAAGDIYHDMFSVLLEQAYVEGKKFARKEKPAKEEPVGDGNDAVFRYYRGTELESTIAAAGLDSYFTGVEGRLAHAKTVSDIKHLFCAKLYHDLIRDMEIKSKVMGCINDFTQKLQDVFIYSVLMLHQDLFKAIGGAQG